VRHSGGEVDVDSAWKETVYQALVSDIYQSRPIYPARVRSTGGKHSSWSYPARSWYPLSNTPADTSVQLIVDEPEYRRTTVLLKDTRPSPPYGSVRGAISDGRRYRATGLSCSNSEVATAAERLGTIFVNIGSVLGARDATVATAAACSLGMAYDALHNAG